MEFRRKLIFIGFIFSIYFFKVTQAGPLIGVQQKTAPNSDSEKPKLRLFEPPKPNTNTAADTSESSDADVDVPDDPELLRMSQNRLFNLNCDTCPPGWGVKSICNGSTNTICAPCPLGFWSPKRPHFRQCTPCAKCGDGLYEDVACTTMQDTICDACSNGKRSVRNEDFDKKCSADRSVDDSFDQMRQKPKIGVSDEDQSRSDEKSISEIDFEAIRNRLKTLGLIGNGKIIEIDFDRLDDDTKKSVHVEDDLTGDRDDETDDAMDEKDSEEELDEPEVWVKRGSGPWEPLKKLGNKFHPTENEEYSDEEDEKLFGTVEHVNANEKDEEADDAKPPALQHIMRPFPKMVPIPKFESDDDAELWKDEPGQIEGKHTEINYPPSYHNYPIASMMHTHQRRKLYFLIGLTCITVISGLCLLLVYARWYRKRHQAAYNHVSVVGLSPEEREIVRQSATKLKSIEKPAVRKFQFNSDGYKPLINSQSQISLAITENPLEKFFDAESTTNRKDEKNSDEK